MTSRWGDNPDTFAFAEYLIGMNVPVFLADEENREGKNFLRPTAWQRTKPRLDVLNRAKNSPRPGKFALGAVSGVRCDYLDVDPRHGGDAALAKLEEMDVLPPHSGIWGTPGGGIHLFLPRSGCRSKHPGESSPYYGLDFQMGSNPTEGDDGGRAYIWIAPTLKRSKINDVEWTTLRGYTEIDPVDIKELERNVHHPRMARWVEFLREEVGVQVRKRITATGENAWTPGTPHTSRQLRFLNGCVRKACRELQSAAPGTSNIVMNNQALWLGGLVTGCGLNESQAYELLLLSARARGAEKPDYHIHRSMEDGKRQPKFFPFTDEEERATWDTYVDEQDIYIEEMLSNLDKAKGVDGDN